MKTWKIFLESHELLSAIGDILSLYAITLKSEGRVLNEFFYRYKNRGRSSDNIQSDLGKLKTQYDELNQKLKGLYLDPNTMKDQDSAYVIKNFINAVDRGRRAVPLYFKSLEGDLTTLSTLKADYDNRVHLYREIQEVLSKHGSNVNNYHGHVQQYPVNDIG